MPIASTKPDMSVNYVVDEGFDHRRKEWTRNLSIKDNEELKHKMNLVKQISIFHELPLENVRTAFERMKTR